MCRNLNRSGHGVVGNNAVDDELSIIFILLVTLQIMEFQSNPIRLTLVDGRSNPPLRIAPLMP